MDGITLELLALADRRALSDVARHTRVCRDCGKDGAALPKGGMLTPYTADGQEMGMVVITADNPWDIWRAALKAVATIERVTDHQLAAFTLMWVDGDTFKQTSVMAGVLATVSVAVDSHNNHLTSIGDWKTTADCAPEVVRTKSTWVGAIEKYFDCKTKLHALPMPPEFIANELRTIVGYVENALDRR